MKPSFTAFLIPKILPALARNKKYSGLLTRQQIAISRRFARECARSDFGIALVNYLTFKRPALWLANNIGIKGLPVHYAARKKYIREKLDKIAADISQVVMIGAGFDTLCIEYHEQYPQIRFFELDQIPTQNIKLSALKKMPTQKLDNNLRFIGCDLSKENLREILNKNDFNSNAKSLFVIEGVLMYLSKSNVEKLLQDIYALSPTGSYIVFGSMAELQATDKRAKLSDAALARRKEKYKFAAPPAEINQILDKAGFKLIEIKLYHELQQNIASDIELKILKNERGEHYYFAQKLN